MHKKNHIVIEEKRCVDVGKVGVCFQSVFQSRYGESLALGV